MTYLLAILVFGLLIFVHELGHFLVAKLSGIAVLQFTIGFGPAIWKKNIGGTVYAIRALPLGGAVMMQGEGEDETEVLLTGKTAEAEAAGEDAPKPKGISFMEASLLKRFLVTIAGATMNFITGVLILLILLVPANYRIDPTLGEFMDGFAYSGETGFQVGDKLVKINDFVIFTSSDVSTALALGAGEPFDFVVERNGERIRLEDMPLEAKIYDQASQSYKYGFTFTTVKMDLWDKITYSGKTAMTYLQSAFASIRMLIGGQASTGDMIGTVGIANEISNAAKQGIRVMLNFVAFISINLAFMNLLPIPALDGGKMLFFLIELVRGKPVDPKYEGAVNLAGMALILVLFVFITYQDIVRLIGG